MRKSNDRLLYYLFIIGFFVLYLGIALISFMHSIQFFSIGNVLWMSVVVGACFELGNFLSLAAILLSEKNRKATMAWILLVIMVSIQCIANTYSTYKYISLSGVEYYQYLAKPLLFWIEEVPQDMIQVIVSWIIGAILPIVALFMTDMVATNYKNIRGAEEDDEETSESDDNSDSDISNDEYEKLVSDISVKKEVPVVHKVSVEENHKESAEKDIVDVPTNKEQEKERTSDNVSILPDEPVTTIDVIDSSTYGDSSEGMDSSVCDSSLYDSSIYDSSVYDSSVMDENIFDSSTAIPTYDMYGSHPYRAGKQYPEW